MQDSESQAYTALCQSCAAWIQALAPEIKPGGMCGRDGEDYGPFYSWCQKSMVSWGLHFNIQRRIVSSNGQYHIL